MAKIGSDFTFNSAFLGYEIGFDGVYILYPLVLAFNSQGPDEIELFLSSNKTAKLIWTDGKFIFLPTAKPVTTREELKAEIEEFLKEDKNETQAPCNERLFKS